MGPLCWWFAACNVCVVGLLHKTVTNLKVSTAQIGITSTPPPPLWFGMHAVCYAFVFCIQDKRFVSFLCGASKCSESFLYRRLMIVHF